MKYRSVGMMWTAKTGYIVMSLLFCLGGLCFLLWPETATALLSRLLGAGLLIFGIVKLIGYFSKDLYRLAFEYDFAFGLLLIVLGLLLVIQPRWLAGILFTAVGIAVLADGLFKLQIAMDARSFGIRSWWEILSLAVCTCGLGLLLVFRPWQSAVVLTGLLGGAMILEGGLNLLVALSTVKIVRNQRPDVLEGKGEILK